ncbi:MAG: protoheme IX farnesyltransferase [Thermoplasmatales archaeon]|jgi:protoheme IX farnesyltransferase|nr:protoheme IX farnesyltransferase [Thermoplasmatales archaeon]
MLEKNFYMRILLNMCKNFTIRMSKIMDYLELGKIKESLLLVFGGAAGGALVNNPFNFIYFYSIIFLLFAVMGTNSITNFIDKDIDKIMERTRKRPLPSNRIKPMNAIYFGIIMILIGILGFLVYSLYYSVIWIIFGIIFDPILYNYLTKRKTPWNIVIGSFAGGAPVMVVWSAVSGSFISVESLLLMLTIVVWTPIHIWSLAIRYRSDYENAGVPMLPVVRGTGFTIKVIVLSSILLMLISSLLSIMLSIYMFFFIMFLNIFMVYMVLKLIFNPQDKTSYLVFKITSPYLAMLFLAVVLRAIF